MTDSKSPGRFRVSTVALLVVVGVASLVGAWATTGTAGSTPVNLLTNGSFETVTPPTTSYEVVPDGNSSIIPGWTAVTPSAYPGGGGSVDVVANSYWNAEDGNY